MLFEPTQPLNFSVFKRDTHWLQENCPGFIGTL